jgi:hypothetical protein
MPGQPSANVENSRCNTHLFQAYVIRNKIETPETGNAQSPIQGTLKFDNSAL